MSTHRDRFTLRYRVRPGDPPACELLARESRLSKTAVKQAMNKGAVWLSRPGAKRRRLRRATAELRPGELLELYYDARILAATAPAPRLIADRRAYSLWYKPAGMVAQGTDYGDHCALTRLAGQALGGRAVWLVHRLDREAAGLMLLAHEAAAARALSAQFREGSVDKRYRVQVRGRPEASGRIELPLDGKPALTQYRLLRYDPESDCSVLEVRLHSGRLHQIRRHLEAVGHPVMGDPRYGRANKNRAGLRLVATVLRFRCPCLGREVEYRLEEAAVGF